MPKKERAAIPTITREQALEMMEALIAGYSTVEFQEQLHRAWAAAAGDPVEQGRARQTVCLGVQGPIVSRYGFEASRRGVAHSVNAFAVHVNPSFDTEWVKHRCHLVGWLVNPAQQEASPAHERDAILAELGLPPRQSRHEETHQVEIQFDTPGIPFTHLIPERPLLHGGFMGGLARAPSAFLTLPPGAAAGLGPLIEYLRDDPTGPFVGFVDEWPGTGAPGGRWDDWGFDVGAQGRERLLKADWHSVHSWGPKRRVFVPRFGDSVGMIRAPSRIVAFVEMFREVNLHCWYHMLSALEELRSRKDATKSLHWLVDHVCTVIRERSHFGAIEAQVWWGPEGTPTRSHKDGATSLLHLSITLGGQRSLRFGSFEKEDSFGPSPWVYSREEWAHWQRFQNCDDSGMPTASQVMKENNVWDDKAWKEGDLKEVSMSMGDVYLSAPFVFEHGVMYNQCARVDPVIALQCRTAFQFERPAFKVNEMRDKDMLLVTRTLAECLRHFGDNGWLRLPTLQEVAAAEHRMAEHLATQMAAIAGGRYVQNVFHNFMAVQGHQPSKESGRGWEAAHQECHEGAAEQRQPQEMGWQQAYGDGSSAAWQEEVPVGAWVGDHRDCYDSAVGEEDHKAGERAEQELVVAGPVTDGQDVTQGTPEEAHEIEAWRVEEDRFEQHLEDVRRRAAEELQRMEAQTRMNMYDPKQQVRLQESRKLNFTCPDIEPQMPDAQLWVAVGGSDTGGILVRKDRDLNSERLRTKLATGALIEELEVVGNRLHYRRLKGDGPDYGWVTIRAAASGKVLVERA